MRNSYEDGYGAEVVMRVTCQRCCEQTFMKQTGYNNMDAASANRHSLLDQFEPIPKGWSIEAKVGWCCPECVKEYDLMIEKFKSNT